MVPYCCLRDANCLGPPRAVVVVAGCCASALQGNEDLSTLPDGIFDGLSELRVL